MGAKARRFRVAGDSIVCEFEAAPEGGYLVSVPMHPSCASQGESFEEALSDAEDALTGSLLSARELELPLPEALDHMLRHAAASQRPDVVRLQHARS